MKRYMLCGLLLAVAVLGFAQNVPEARIKSLSGTVELKFPQSGEWVRAQAGALIERGVLISTGFRSTLVLSLGDSELTVKPLTRLTLEEILARDDTDQVSLYLRAGRVRAEVNSATARRSDFTVRSPIATASVRGTVFEFDAVNLDVFQGTVNFALVSPDLASPLQDGEARGSETAAAAAAETPPAGEPGVLVYAGESSYIGVSGRPVAPELIMVQGVIPGLPVGLERTLAGPAESAGSSSPDIIPGGEGTLNAEVTW